MTQHTKTHDEKSCSTPAATPTDGLPVLLEDLDLPRDFRTTSNPDELDARVGQIREAVDEAIKEAFSAATAGRTFMVTFEDYPSSRDHYMLVTYCRCGREILDSVVRHRRDRDLPDQKLGLDHLSWARTRIEDERARAVGGHLNVYGDAIEALKDAVYNEMGRYLPEQIAAAASVRFVLLNKDESFLVDRWFDEARGHLELLARLVFARRGTPLAEVSNRLAKDWSGTASELIAAAERELAAGTTP